MADCLLSAPRSAAQRIQDTDTRVALHGGKTP